MTVYSDIVRHFVSEFDHSGRVYIYVNDSSDDMIYEFEIDQSFDYRNIKNRILISPHSIGLKNYSSSGFLGIKFHGRFDKLDHGSIDVVVSKRGLNQRVYRCESSKAGISVYLKTIS